MWELTLGTVANIASTSPPTRSPRASPAPLYDTIVTSIPASILSSSIRRRAGDPGHRGKVDRPRLGPRKLHEVLRARRAQARTHDEHQRPAHEERYGGEIGERVVREIPEQVRIGGMAVEHREQRVSVRRRPDRGRRAKG